MDRSQLLKWSKVRTGKYETCLDTPESYCVLEVTLQPLSDPLQWSWLVLVEDTSLGSGTAKSKRKAQRKAEKFLASLTDQCASDQRALRKLQEKLSSLTEQRLETLDLLEEYQEQSGALIGVLLAELEQSGTGVHSHGDALVRLGRMDLKVHHALRER